MKNPFKGLGIINDNLVFLSPKEARQLLDKDVILVDLREDKFKNGRQFQVNKLITLPYHDLEQNYSILPKDKPLILADFVGIKSKLAMVFLKKHGFELLASLIGGITDWEKEGMPIQINHDEELVGGCVCQLRPRNGKKVTNLEMEIKKVLILCTGNSCRSIMAEALINQYRKGLWEASSAGISPSQVNPRAIQVMLEIGIDIRNYRSKSVKEFLDRDDLDLVITVCDNAKETCPVFLKPVKTVHFSFEDPAEYNDQPDEIALPVFRRIRDEIKKILINYLKDLDMGNLV